MLPDAPGPADWMPFASPGALRDPERLLAIYFNSPAAGVCIVGSDLRILASNRTLAEISGAPLADSLGKTVSEALGEAAALIEPELQRALSSGEPLLNVEASATFAGRPDPTHWIGHYFPVKDADGIVTRIGLIVIETTEQKRLEESNRRLSGELRRETSRFRALLDVSEILTADWDVPRVFPKISARLRRLLHQEYAGVSLHDPSSGLLVRQAEDFPLGREGLTSSVQVSANTPDGVVLRQGAPTIYSPEHLQTFDSEVVRKLMAEGIKSLCCVPLLVPKGPMGVLVLGSTRRSAFQSDDLLLLSQVAAQLAIAIENHRVASEVDDLRQRFVEERKYLEGTTRFEGTFAEIIGESRALKQVLDQVAIVAGSDATVLILGETGTGKELIARAIHRTSQRHGRSFVKVNCAAIPTGLLESELFGHEKGAFTGAVSQKIGRMEMADGGTLFLDEVGEIPLDLQPKLLRVLQDQEFERLGSTRTLKVNVRLVAATNRDLARSVAEHQFRNDLFYRLNVFPIRLPSLRERREDIPLLVRYFVRRFSGRMQRNIESIPKETMEALLEWSWPGNVRELENLMERAVILSDGPVLRVPLEALRTEPVAAVGRPDHTLDYAEREHIIRVLRETGGVLSGPSGAAHRLGLKRTTLQSKMQRLGIARHNYCS